MPVSVKYIPADDNQRAAMAAAAKAGDLIATPPRPWMRDAGWLPGTNFMGAPDDERQVADKLNELNTRHDQSQLETIRQRGMALVGQDAPPPPQNVLPQARASRPAKTEDASA